MYAKNTKLGINFPIEHIQKVEKVGHRVFAPITVEGFDTSKYIIMKADDLIKVDNIKIDDIVKDLFLYENDGHYMNSNFLLLEFIKAYDKTNKEAFLDGAVRVAEWLKKADCLEGLSTVNYLQCIARKTGLSDEQDLLLEEMLESVSGNEQMKAAIHILLGNYKMASRCINRMDSEQKKEFCSFPIYKLMNIVES